MGNHLKDKHGYVLGEMYGCRGCGYHFFTKFDLNGHSCPRPSDLNRPRVYLHHARQKAEAVEQVAGVGKSAVPLQPLPRAGVLAMELEILVCHHCSLCLELVQAKKLKLFSDLHCLCLELAEESLTSPCLHRLHLELAEGRVLRNSSKACTQECRIQNEDESLESPYLIRSSCFALIILCYPRFSVITLTRIL